MKILIPCEIRTDGTDNPFGFHLLKSLALHDEIENVQYGVAWLFEKDIDYDIILFQWLERIYRNEEPSQNELLKLKDALEFWKDRAKIIVTIHNEFPHFKDSPVFRELYELVFSFADGFIHFGEASKEILRNRYKAYLEISFEAVIPHGNYNLISNNVSKSQARAKLDYTEEDSILLSFGAIRSREELQLLLTGYSNSKSKIDNLKLLVVGRMPVRTRTNFQYFIDRIPLWFKKDIQLVEDFVPQDEVQFYLNTADVLFIPRINSLNSGNVALGFTFGKIVVGPDIGVIGEELKKNHNPVFEPQNPASVVKAITKAFDLRKSETAANNKSYAESVLDWKNVADQHVDFFKRTFI